MRLALASVAALSVLAAACGSIEREPNLAKASERTATTSSFRMEMQLRMVEDGKPIRMTCTGAFDNARERGRLSCAEPQTTSFEAIYIGEDEYTKLPDDERWLKSTAQGSNAAFLSEEFSPDRLLGVLQAASRETERLGEDTVRGAATVRYRLLVDCDEAELGCPSGDLGSVDVWIDDDGLVRRIELEQDGTTVDVEFFDFDVPLEIEPPPADQVTEDESTYTIEPCDPGNERPIRVQQAIDVLGEHGFEMTRGEFGCSAGIAASLSTRVDDSEYLSCFVLARPRSEDSSITVTEAIDMGPSGPEPVEREVENLDCTLFLERKDDAAVARLDAALTELKRAVRP